MSAAKREEGCRMKRWIRSFIVETFLYRLNFILPWFTSVLVVFSFIIQTSGESQYAIKTIFYCYATQSSK